MRQAQQVTISISSEALLRLIEQNKLSLDEVTSLDKNAKQVIRTGFLQSLLVKKS